MKTNVSLFTGIGGLDLSAEWAGFETILQVERDPYCLRVLGKYWPDVKRITDIREVNRGSIDRTVDVISGGDPCPIRSRARANRPSKHPDLSGYFLSVVGYCRPKWVVRENVVASDVIDFAAALDVLGYRSVITTSNAAPYTGQNRTREIIVGHLKEAWIRKFELLYKQYCNEGIDKAKHYQTEAYPCLTTHPWRYDARDGYVWEEGTSALRVADADERVRLAGFPDGWLDGLSFRTVARLTGNAVVPQQAYPIFRAIAEML